MTGQDKYDLEIQVTASYKTSYNDGIRNLALTSITVYDY